MNLTFQKFTVPERFKGLNDAVNGFRILKLELTRQEAFIHVHKGIFEIVLDKAVSYFPVEGFVVHLIGSDYAALKDATPIVGLTREQDILSAAYRAVANSKGWTGTIKIGTD